MRGILRLGLMMLLVAAAGVGNVWGEEVWVTSGNWQYAKIDETTCRIKPTESHRSSISGTVTVPNYVGDEFFRVVEIAENAFSGCSALEAVEILNSVTTIGEQAFYRCGLKAVDIPNSVETIQRWAFYGCEELKEVKIPSSVNSIGDYAFSHCKELTAFKVDEKNARYSEDGGVLFTKDMQMLKAYPGGRKGAYEIPSSVTGIAAGAFSGCSGLTAVVIPSSVKSILGWTFSNCSGLTAVTIPDGMTVIEKYAFNACKELKEVTIPGSVERIDECAFKDCKSLNTVYVYRPNDQEFTVDEKAFEGIGGNSATLYVRSGMKEKIKDKPWRKNKFTNIVEFCVVTFDEKGGTPASDVKIVEEGKTATAPTGLTKDGYTLVEWQLGGAKYDFSTPVTKDITLVAVWKQNYTVTFDAKGGTPTPDAQTVVEDGTATAPTLTKDGYTFVEWRLDGKKYDFSTKVTKDITLVAKWKKKKEESTPKDPKTAVESVQLAGVRVVRNPVGEALELEGMERAARVEVYSVVGAQVHAEALRGEPRVVIDAQGWASGVYVVRVVASDGAKTLRVVK